MPGVRDVGRACSYCVTHISGGEHKVKRDKAGRRAVFESYC